jgi:hypothetical protein
VFDKITGMALAEFCQPHQGCRVYGEPIRHLHRDPFVTTLM